MSDTLHPNGNGTDNGAFRIPVLLDDVVTPFTGTVGTDFLMFAVGGGANIEAQEDYFNDPQRPTGNLPGLARSNFNNKAIRQGTFVAHSLCLWVSQQIQAYVPDDGNDIAWIGEFTQALSSFLLALLPPGPNLGAYLPLSGGNMFGNITFNPGISTILANNTWYFGRDTAGTARGLMIKGSDNNIYINDGTCPYVMFNGSPIVNNNLYYGARSTTGSLHGVIGLLSDNNTHVSAGSAAHIFLDCGTGGSVWTNGNIVLNNGQFYYCKTADAAPRGVLGITTGNELQLGGGHPWVTGIYAGGGQWIYMHANVVNTLGQLIVNQYSYLNGGGRAYIPGGNDPWQIYADQGFYSRTHFIVGNTRDWTAGCLRGGTFGIADESAAAMRFEIDLNGNGHFYNNLYASDCGFGGTTVTAFHATAWAQVDGGLTVYNSLNVASGNLTVSGGSYLYGGSQIWNGLTVQTGVLNVNGGSTIGGGLTVYNSFNMASGTMWVNGPAYLYSNLYLSGGIQIGGAQMLYNNAANSLYTGGNLQIGGQFNSNTVYTNFIQDYGSMTVNGGITVYQDIWLPNGTMTSQVCNFRNGTVSDILWVNSGLCTWNIEVGGTAVFLNVSHFQAIANLNQGFLTNNWGTFGFHSQTAVDAIYNMGSNGHAFFGVVTYNVYYPSDAREKKDIADLPDNCLELVQTITPKRYRWNHGADQKTTHWGFIAQNVGEVMHEHGLDFGGHVIGSGLPGTEVKYGEAGDDQKQMLNINELVAVLWRAVQELAEQVKAKH